MTTQARAFEMAQTKTDGAGDEGGLRISDVHGDRTETP